MGHVLLFHLLDRHFLARLLVQGKLDQAKLTLSQRFVERVELEDVGVSHGLLEPSDPLSLVLLLREEDEARLVWWDHKLDWKEILASLPLFLPTLGFFLTLRGLLGGADLRSISRALTLFRYFVHSDIFEIGACQAVHDFMAIVTLFSEETQLVARQQHPVLLIALRLCFQVAVARVLNDVFAAVNVFKASEAFKHDLILSRCLGADGS